MANKNINFISGCGQEYSRNKTQYYSRSKLTFMFSHLYMSAIYGIFIIIAFSFYNCHHYFQLRMHVGVRDDGIMTDEDVELNYEQNYVRVITPGRSGISPVVMIHDYNLVIIFLEKCSCLVII